MPEICGWFKQHITHNEVCELPKGHKGKCVLNKEHDCMDCGKHHGVCRRCGTTQGHMHESGCKWYVPYTVSWLEQQRAAHLKKAADLADEIEKLQTPKGR